MTGAGSPAILQWEQVSLASSDSSLTSYPRWAWEAKATWTVPVETASWRQACDCVAGRYRIHPVEDRTLGLIESWNVGRSTPLPRPQSRRYFQGRSIARRVKTLAEAKRLAEADNARLAQGGAP
jgi:hypothetical protein